MQKRRRSGFTVPYKKGQSEPSETVYDRALEYLESNPSRAAAEPLGPQPEFKTAREFEASGPPAPLESCLEVTGQSNDELATTFPADYHDDVNRRREKPTPTARATDDVSALFSPEAGTCPLSKPRLSPDTKRCSAKSSIDSVNNNLTEGVGRKPFKKPRKSTSRTTATLSDEHSPPPNDHVSTKSGASDSRSTNAAPGTSPATYIEKLHEYNELKDTASELLGKLAELKMVTVKDMYEEYGVELDD